MNHEHQLIITTKRKFHTFRETLHLILTIRSPSEPLEHSSEEILIEDYLEQHKDELRNDFLINNDFAQHPGFQTLHQIFSIKSGFSAWDLSSFSETSNIASSPEINDQIIIFALNRLLLSLFPSIESISITSAPPSVTTLILSIHSLKKQKVKLSPSSRLTYIFFQLSQLFTIKLSAIISILATPILILFSTSWLVIYTIFRRDFFLKSVAPNLLKQNDLLLFSYFCHLDPTSFRFGKYQSTYWGALPTLLEKNELNTAFIHFYVPSLGLSPRDAIRLSENHNSNSDLCTKHYILETFLSLKILLVTYIDYLRLSIKSIFGVTLFITLVASQSPYSSLRLYFLNYLNSFAGLRSIRTMLYLNLFISVAKASSPCPYVIYLQEGISWETSLNYAFRCTRDPVLIAYQYCFVRYWDLRYYRYHSAGNTYLVSPRPSYIATTAYPSNSIMSSSSLPIETIPVESLRYSLENSTPSDIINQYPLNSYSSDSIRLLVLGELNLQATRAVLSLLENALSLASFDLHITFKPHPLLKLQRLKIPHKIQISHAKITDLAHKHTCALVSDMTAASYDTASLSLPTFIFSPNIISFNPLYSYSNVVSVSDAIQLLNALDYCKTNYSTKFSFLDTNPSFPRWNRLLATIRDKHKKLT